MSNNETLAVKMAQHIVTFWESIEATAVAFQERCNASDELRRQMVIDMKMVAGGREIYLASKRFLEDR